MTKHYCDRCGVECDKLNSVRVTVKNLGNGSSLTETMEVCPACEKDGERIITYAIDLIEHQKKRIEEADRLINALNSVMKECRDELDDLVYIDTVKEWLTKLGIENATLVTGDDFGDSCYKLATMMDELKRFAKDYES